MHQLNKKKHSYYISLSIVHNYLSLVKEEFQLLSYNSSDILCSCLDLEPTIGITANSCFEPYWFDTCKVSASSAVDFEAI